MSKVIAVLGAGTGLGVSVARRFGREGFRVALVARRKDRLDTLLQVLAGEGIEAVAFTADLSQPAEVPALIEAIRDRFARIDVVAYGPISGDQGFTPAAKLDAATLQGLSPLLLFTPVEVVRAVLPEWTERGEGAFLLAQGYSAAQPMPHLSGLGPVMSATRNYLYSLNAELADTGIYVGALTIASLIARSEVSAAAQAAFESADGPHFPVADPDDLAEHYWNMYTKRDRVEQFHPESLTPQATA
ncbi:SDR family NAD(P)-dependent oxidoreductase [Streptomyces rapamycinicus]|uniref:Short-chain dehydrogenase n=2 Tax=Streptomyces rapamycinicus TaxID=1226757 RepID=A0A0A0NBH7_STRRN|nr:SDR family NAD(P)-dependent oxidoreductase [Streptomyces rapamycinicus]AGP51800.1 short-chain dehydrogenase [Streptomyces rapamycinicus NRRL 5491]MBB4779217.1 short-subunit dehydrogenase [Streptomyces rapamycinicus]RLV76118.1 short-chain dehydrogenase [Streptomyces rapamycinicus NRRL 5491]UTP28021.1 SDR family NAD(P)-dependent oxidoreductase [Streptomyces rapamycinicus NRRL 5491]